MRRIAVPVLTAALLLTGGCTDQTPDPTSPLQSLAPAADRAAIPFRNAVAVLSGGEEVPAVDTRARGNAKFQLSADGTELHYRLIVANIENVRMAHIHLAPAGSNGGVVVWLYPSAPPPVLIEGRTDGVLAEGTITAADLTGALAGQDLEALLQAMEDGQAYVNVHTVAHPGGEIRGQIRTGG